MTTTYEPAAPARSTSQNTVLRAILGIICVLPAALLCFTALARPSVQTLLMSFQKVDPFGKSEPVGAANYTFLLSDETFSGALGFTVSMLMVRLVIVAVVPLLLALAASAAGRGGRILARLLFTVPLAIFAPLGAVTAWRIAINPVGGFFGPEAGRMLADPTRAPGTVLLIDGLITAGLACGLGLLFYLAALRTPVAQEGGVRHARSALLLCWITGLLATVALTLQSFTLSYGLTNGGPARSTTTLALLQYTQSFQFFRMGLGAATASITLAVCALLGFIVGLVVLFSRARLVLRPWREPSRSTNRGLGIIALAIAILISIIVGGFGLLPLVWSLLHASGSANGLSEVLEQTPLARMLVNTYAPAMVLLAVQVPITYLGALGIGAVRPLGRWSEILLLPFSLWLFVTPMPLSITFYMNLAQAEQLNTIQALVPPITLNIPALFLLTLFFKGQHGKWREATASGGSAAGTFFTTMLLPSLPLTFLFACATLLLATRDLFWPLLTSVSSETRTLSVMLLLLQQSFAFEIGGQAQALALFIVPSALLFLVVFGIFQVFYLDRIALATGREE